MTSPADLPQYARIHQPAFLTTADGVSLEETKWLLLRDPLDHGIAGPVRP